MNESRMNAPPLQDRRTPAVVVRRRLAFTLIELLVVIGIIVLLIALALPAFNFITGSRSTEAAGNQVAAALGIARSQAIGIQDVKGVAVYHNALTDKTIAALVEVKHSPFDIWPSSATPPGYPVSFRRGEYRLYSDDVYVCLENHSIPDSSIKPDASTFWRKMPSMKDFPSANADATFVDLQPGGDFVVLPTGIEARAAGNQVNFPEPAAAADTTNRTYRYFNPAVFLFDANGQIVTSGFYIAQEGLLGSQCDLSSSSAYAFPAAYNATPSNASKSLPYGGPKKSVIGGAAVYSVTSQIGLVLYNSDTFKNAVGNGTPAAQSNWLDENGSPLMINRYNGTLVRSE